MTGSSVAMLVLLTAGCLIGGGLVIGFYGIVAYRWMNNRDD